MARMPATVCALFTSRAYSGRVALAALPSTTTARIMILSLLFRLAVVYPLRGGDGLQTDVGSSQPLSHSLQRTATWVRPHARADSAGLQGAVLVSQKLAISPQHQMWSTQHQTVCMVRDDRRNWFGALGRISLIANLCLVSDAYITGAWF